MISPHDHDLLQAYLDGALSITETADLEKRIANEPALAEAWVLLSREEAIIREWAAVADRTQRIESQLTTRHQSATAMRRWVPIAMAASLLIAIGLVSWNLRFSNHPASVVAVLEYSAGQVFLVESEVRTRVTSGTSIFSGQGLELQGDESSAVVKYADGTRLEFDGDVLVTELSDDEARGKRVVLAEGTLRADVAKQPAGRPMAVKTASAEVIVLGTKFDLVGGTEATHVETSEGVVRLIRSGDGRAIDVPAGFEGRAEGAADMNAQPSPPRYRRSRFATPASHRTMLLSPAGNTLVTTQFGLGRVAFWNVSDGSEQRSWEAHSAPIEATAFSSDGRLFATGASDRSLKLWSAETGELQQTLEAPEHLQSVAFADDDRVLLVLAGLPQRGMELHTLDLMTHRLRGDPQPIRGEAWAFSPTGRLLAVSSARDVSVTVWDTLQGRKRAEFQKWPGGRVFCLALSPDDLRLAIADRSDRVVIRDLSDPSFEQVFSPPGGAVQGLAFSPDGNDLAMGQRYATIRVVDLRSGRQRFVLEGDRPIGSTASVRPMCFTPDGKSLAATQSLDRGILRIWDLPPR